MNLIGVKGGNKFQKEIAAKVVAFMIKELMPRVRTLDITVLIKNKLADEAVGYCDMGDTNREFTIEIDKTQSLKDFITTLTHEMIHVKQYYRKEMNPYNHAWKGRKVKDDMDYMDLPWEKEAWKLQDKYAQMVWDADIL